MSGKRLIKTHTLRAVSVNSLQECQEACIAERSFNCRFISYRYMPSSGYSYPVSNFEMSSYYMQSGTISNSYSKLDFVEDYDYFQRETHCKTTGSTTLGVCAVVVRRGGRVSTTLIKSSHHTVTYSQCEHLCATSLFRCRAFSFRHTTRGRDPYATRYAPTSPFTPTPTRDLPPSSDHTCLLYDTDLMRLPSYNIEPDQDFDLFEMGRLMGAECVLYEQFLNSRPGYYRPQTSVFDSSRGPVYGSSGGSYNGNNYDSSRGSSGGHYDDRRTNIPGYDKFNNNNYHQRPHVVSSTAQDHVHVPPSTLETGLMIGGQGSSRVECVRSVEVLRFPCRAMAYRHTTHSSSLDQRSGGTCQLSDTDPRDPDLMQARDRDFVNTSFFITTGSLGV